MDTFNLVLAGLFLLAVLYIGARVVMKPVKLLWKILVNSLIGLILLILVNYISTPFGFELHINIFTVLIAGFLGIPGIVLLICFQLLLK
jgi:pro-sigmaK processing inhibitor BofA